MVERKKSRIGKKPEVSALTPDSWVQEGGLDPEATPVERPVPVSPEPKDEKPFPHRISFDMATPQYKRLKYAAYASERTMNEILREAIEHWMNSRGY